MKIEFDLKIAERDALRDAINFILLQTAWDLEGDLKRFSMFLRDPGKALTINIFEAVRLHDTVKKCIGALVSAKTINASPGMPMIQLVALIEFRMILKFAINDTDNR